MIGRRLEGPEMVGYNLVDPHVLEVTRVVRVPFLAPGTSGMTLGNHVLLIDDTDRSGRRTLLAHELVHVRQFTERGSCWFLAFYIRDYLRGLIRHHNHRQAYLAIPTEIEARREAEAWATDFG